MSVDATTPRSRRALLSAAAATAATAAAAAVSRPLEVTADTGDPLILGQANVAGDMTFLDGQVMFQGPSTTPGTTTLQVTAQGSGNVAVFAEGLGGTGVLGETEAPSPGVRAWWELPGAILESASVQSIPMGSA